MLERLFFEMGGQTYHHNLVVILRLEDLQLLVLEQFKVALSVGLILLSTLFKL